MNSFRKARQESYKRNVKILVGDENVTCAHLIRKK